MISDFLWDISDSVDGSVDDLNLPAGSIGDVLNGTLRLPEWLLDFVASVLGDMGS